MGVKAGEPFFYKAAISEVGQKFILDKNIPLQYSHMRHFFDIINEKLESVRHGKLSREVRLSSISYTV